VCLILFSLGHHPRFPLIVAANRDENHARAAVPLAFWDEAPQVAAGRDRKAGGTWLGITRGGRWAALTNFRRAGSYNPEAPSRGHLVSDFLEGKLAPEDYIERIRPSAHAFNGFNLLVGDMTRVLYLSNREAMPRLVPPGVHGLSNHLLDTPWPKVVSGKRTLAALPDAQAAELTSTLLQSLRDSVSPPDAALPDTGVGLASERVLSPPFILSERYGTRASTVILVDRHGTVSMVEHSFGPMGVPAGTAALTFALDAAKAVSAT
jgi:uncharacterized protein with NRDE domain